jgi:hypothetical protein
LTLPFRRSESLILQGSDETTLSTLQCALPVRAHESFILDRSQDATLGHIKPLGKVVHPHVQVVTVLCKSSPELD